MPPASPPSRSTPARSLTRCPLPWGAGTTTGGERLRGVLARSSFLIDGQPAGVRPHQEIILADTAVIEVLPPFAGG